MKSISTHYSVTAATRKSRHLYSRSPSRPNKRSSPSKTTTSRIPTQTPKITPSTPKLPSSITPARRYLNEDDASDDNDLTITEGTLFGSPSVKRDPTTHLSSATKRRKTGYNQITEIFDNTKPTHSHKSCFSLSPKKIHTDNLIDLRPLKTTHMRSKSNITTPFISSGNLKSKSAHHTLQISKEFGHENFEKVSTLNFNSRSKNPSNNVSSSNNNDHNQYHPSTLIKSPTTKKLSIHDKSSSFIPRSTSKYSIGVNNYNNNNMNEVSPIPRSKTQNDIHSLRVNNSDYHNSLSITRSPSKPRVNNNNNNNNNVSNTEKDKSAGNFSSRSQLKSHQKSSSQSHQRSNFNNISNTKSKHLPTLESAKENRTLDPKSQRFNITTTSTRNGSDLKQSKPLKEQYDSSISKSIGHGMINSKSCMSVKKVKDATKPEFIIKEDIKENQMKNSSFHLHSKSKSKSESTSQSRVHSNYHHSLSITPFEGANKKNSTTRPISTSTKSPIKNPNDESIANHNHNHNQLQNIPITPKKSKIPRSVTITHLSGKTDNDIIPKSKSSKAINSHLHTNSISTKEHGILGFGKTPDLKLPNTKETKRRNCF